MAVARNPRISARKEPQQARSAGLIATVLEASAQVLAAEGAHRFTVGRVAERAGVSVGSIYQYFPNKAAILFRLQTDEWRRTTELLQSILEDASLPPPDRLRKLVRAFLASECEEAELRLALSDAAPLYREAPETRDAREPGASLYRRFIDTILPGLPAAERAVTADLIETTLSQVGKFYSATPRSEGGLAAFAEAMADMFCAYLDRQARRHATGHVGDAE